jgi:hypothetical protein
MCIPSDLRKGFDSMVLLVTWMIWKERNHRAFDSSCTLPPGLVTVVVEKGNIWIEAGFVNLASC